MKLLFFIVNYQADDCLLNLVRSIVVAKSACDSVETVVHVLDNSIKDKIAAEDFKHKLQALMPDVVVLDDGTNSGYFGGLPLAQQAVDESFDYVVYCNPDIRLNPDFIKKLAVKKYSAGVIAPAIIIDSLSINENPKYLFRLSKNKLRRLKFTYSNMILDRLFFLLYLPKEWLVSLHHKSKLELERGITSIYAPHGALFLFSNIPFFKQLPAYPCFLFGEELFVAEEARKAKVSICYDPDLVVMDTRSVSMSLLDVTFKRPLYLKSIEYILDNYYV